MKILHLITSLKIGGAESALVNFLQAIKHPPYTQDTHIVAYFHDGPNVQVLQQLGFELHHITGRLSYTSPEALWKLAKLIKTTKPDILHSALWSANIIGRCMARLFKIPIICDIHGNSFDEGIFRNWFDRATAHYANAIVAVSTSTQEAYKKNILSRSKKKPAIITINNGIDCHALRIKAQEHPRTRQEFGLSTTDFVIGAIGRLEPIKSYDLLIKAFHNIVQKKLKLQTIKLMIVGGGSQEGALRELTEHLGIQQNVIFVGAQPHAIGFYPLFDCFALSSQSEGLSIALLEALCFGLPIITTHHAKNHDVIVDRMNGLLVPCNNIPSLADAITTLATDKSLQTVMNSNNRILVENDFSLQSTVDSYDQLYKKIQTP